MIKYQIHATEKNKAGKEDSKCFREWGSNFKQVVKEILAEKVTFERRSDCTGGTGAGFPLGDLGRKLHGGQCDVN